MAHYNDFLVLLWRHFTPVTLDSSARVSLVDSDRFGGASI